MFGGGFQCGHDPVIVIIRIRGGLRKPDDLFGINRLPVDHGGNLAVTAAGVKTDPAAVQVPADGLGLVMGFRKPVDGNHLEGMLKDLGHEVGVKGLLSSLTVGVLQICADFFIPADKDPETALHPEKGFDKALNIIAVGVRPLRGAVDERADRGHLTAGTLDGDTDGLFGIGKKGIVKTLQRVKIRVQLGNVLQIDFNSVSVHQDPSGSEIILKGAVPSPGRRQKLRLMRFNKCAAAVIIASLCESVILFLNGNFK